MKLWRSMVLLSFLLLWLIPQCLTAQTRPSRSSESTVSDSTRQNAPKGTGLFNRPVATQDTFDTQFFYMDNPFLILDKQDTLLDGLFSQPDPAFQGEYSYANLGNLGSPLTPLVYQSEMKNGLRSGFHSFDPYYLKKEGLKFYRLHSPYTNATYNQGRTQDDQNLKLEFATEFGKSLSFTIQHDRINHRGVYQQQLARDYAMNTGFWYHHPDGKYQNFLTYTANSTVHLENGGVNYPDTFAGNLQRERTVPVLLNADTTRYRMRTVGLRQYYHLRNPSPKTLQESENLKDFPMIDRDSLSGKKVDSTYSTLEREILSAIPNDSIKIAADSSLVTIDTSGIDSIGMDSLAMARDSLSSDLIPKKLKKRKKPKKENYIDPNRLMSKRRQISLGHDLNFFTGFYKYADLNPDSSFYKNFYVYNQGLQYKLNHSGVENQFFITTSSIGSKSAGKTQTPRDFFKAGIKYSYNKYSQNSDSSSTNNISLFGNIDYSPIKNIAVQAEGSFHFAGYNAGDYSLSGSVNLKLDRVGSLKAIALSQAYEPSIFQSRFYISGFEFWNNDFQKTLETKLGGTLTIDKTNTTISTNFHLLDNYIYLDTLGIANQKDEIFAISQLIVKQNFKLGVLHLDNVVVLQQTNDEILALPQIYSRHKLYVESPVFKNKVLLRIGAATVFHTSYKARRYQPIIGQFYNSNQTLKYYPQVDPFLSFKRERLRFYVRMENAASFIIPDQFGYRTPDYPIPYRVFRFGLSWVLLN